MNFRSRESILHRLKPTNKERLDDDNILDVLDLVNTESYATVINSLWTSALFSSVKEETQQKFIGYVNNAIRGAADAPVVLLPLFDQEHWSLLVLLLDGEPGQYRYFHLDSVTPSFHTPIYESIVAHLHLTPQMRIKLPFSVPPQRHDFECGHFILMCSAAIISFFSNATLNHTERDLLLYLKRDCLSASYRNLSAFNRKITLLL